MKNSDMPATGCTLKEEVKNSMGSGTKMTTYKGLTKREYFAGLALEGLLSHGNYQAKNKFSRMAIDAVCAADQLLLALENDIGEKSII